MYLLSHTGMIEHGARATSACMDIGVVFWSLFYSFREI